MMRRPWVWNEIEHWTGIDLMETLQLLTEQVEADDFIESYAEVCEDDDHAAHNIEYMVGIIGSSDHEEGDRLAELFGVDFSTAEPVSPRQWWANSSLGLKETA